MYDMMYDEDAYDEDAFLNYEGPEDMAVQRGPDYQDIIKYCVFPTFMTAYLNIFRLLIACFLFRALTQIIRRRTVFKHILSATFGVAMLQVYFKINCLQVIGFALASSFVVPAFGKIFRRRGLPVTVFVLLYLVLCEIYLINPETWQVVRGAQMIIGMKIISLAIDADNHYIEEPTFFESVGYTLNVGTCIFGPWVSFKEYQNIYKFNVWNINWIFKWLLSLLLSMLCFTLANCWLEWILDDKSSALWLIYRDALVFRVGHYFVSYVSETSSVMSGYGSSGDNGNWNFNVTNPLKVEIPHSLVQVVVNWNVPMHKWLKTYVFKTTLQYGNFIAIMSTYGMSALLHGLNYRLAGVLLSLGFYTFIEYQLRGKLSKLLSACISAKPCPSLCTKHRFPTSNLMVNATNLQLKALTMLHLSYLGLLLDVTDSKSVPFSKAFRPWEQLNFFSHWVVMGTAILYCVLCIFS